MWSENCEDCEEGAEEREKRDSDSLVSSTFMGVSSSESSGNNVWRRIRIGTGSRCMSASCEEVGEFGCGGGSDISSGEMSLSLSS
jgi:hypothetical protein